MRPFTPSGEKQRTVDLTRGFTIAIHPDGQQILAQTFTPRRDQSLGYLQLPVGCAAGVLLRVRIREGIDGTILSEFNIIDLPQVVDGEFELLQVYDPAVSSDIPLTSGVTYAFELAAVPTTGPVHHARPLIRMRLLVHASAPWHGARGRWHRPSAGAQPPT
jgi:hypothetical protein